MSRAASPAPDPAKDELQVPLHPITDISHACMRTLTIQKTLDSRFCPGHEVQQALANARSRKEKLLAKIGGTPKKEAAATL